MMIYLLTPTRIFNAIWCYILIFVFFLLYLQINLSNFDETDRSLTTGPNILHKHSINSLFEQHDLITRGLTSPTEGKFNYKYFFFFFYFS